LNIWSASQFQFLFFSSPKTSVCLFVYLFFYMFYVSSSNLFFLCLSFILSLFAHDFPIRRSLFIYIFCVFVRLLFFTHQSLFHKSAVVAFSFFQQHKEDSEKSCCLFVRLSLLCLDSEKSCDIMFIFCPILCVWGGPHTKAKTKIIGKLSYLRIE